MARTNGLNLTRAKKQNAITMMEILYKYAPITRHQMANMMGLSVPTITTNIAELMKNGVVKELNDEGEEKEGCLGRKARPVDLVSTNRYFLGVEITPIRSTFCLTDLRFQNIEMKEEYRGNVGMSYEELLDDVAETLLKIVSAHEDIRDRIAGVGVGVPGFVDSKSGVVRSMGRFKWQNKALRADLEARLRIPVCVENNVRVRVIEEDMLNGSIRPETFAYLFVSLGIACPLLIKDSILTGNNAGAGEIGHMILQDDGPVCDVCGKRGCLDSLASETAIVNSCQQILEQGKAPLLRKKVEANGRLTMHEIIHAQAAQDEDVCQIVRQTVRHLAIAVANMANFISPNLVIVDAYVMKLAENRELFLNIVREYLFGINEKEMEIEFKEYDRYAGCKGAAAYAIQTFFIREQR